MHPTRFWGVFFALVTLGIWVFKPEGEGFSEEELRSKERAHALLHPEEIEKGVVSSFVAEPYPLRIVYMVVLHVLCPELI
jgi:hypothetical protein